MKQLAVKGIINVLITLISALGFNWHPWPYFLCSQHVDLKLICCEHKNISTKDRQRCQRTPWIFCSAVLGNKLLLFAGNKINCIASYVFSTIFCAKLVILTLVCFSQYGIFEFQVEKNNIFWVVYFHVHNVQF